MSSSIKNHESIAFDFARECKNREYTEINQIINSFYDSNNQNNTRIGSLTKRCHDSIGRNLTLQIASKMCKSNQYGGAPPYKVGNGSNPLDKLDAGLKKIDRTVADINKTAEQAQQTADALGNLAGMGINAALAAKKLFNTTKKKFSESDNATDAQQQINAGLIEAVKKLTECNVQITAKDAIIKKLEAEITIFKTQKLPPAEKDVKIQQLIEENTKLKEQLKESTEMCKKLCDETMEEILKN